MIVSLLLLTVIVLADDLRIGAEARAPVVVAEHRDRTVAALVVVGRDHAADGGADAEHLEVGAGDELARDALGLAVDADVHRDGTAREHPGEHFARRRAVGDLEAHARQRRR